MAVAVPARVMEPVAKLPGPCADAVPDKVSEPDAVDCATPAVAPDRLSMPVAVEPAVDALPVRLSDPDAAAAACADAVPPRLTAPVMAPTDSTALPLSAIVPVIGPTDATAEPDNASEPVTAPVFHDAEPDRVIEPVAVEPPPVAGAVPGMNGTTAGSTPDASAITYLLSSPASQAAAE